ncbi:hypothetical protein E3U55_10000 [Filobacillus milosensis]|uniref:Uncharacterized protein n=1 Tax=Filobacillus milosensis TaxID=94137 RepID=A0A4Y8IK55_9BACI|nr:hypothetical protein [Filobacillus milosensis]TFB21141.1 hypothetical protein E3U55_10000 [Filobacillus milosensis]
MNYYPARVISIENNYIKIRGYLDNESKRRIFKECDIKDITTNELVITYISSTSDAFSDINLIEKLLLIRDIGIPFNEDHKVIYSPAEFMRELLDRGYKIGQFNAINGYGTIREFG